MEEVCVFFPLNFNNFVSLLYRSGQYCYKPTMARTCCPLYTIKCNATEFQLSKSQKKVLKKFRSFLMHDKRPPGSERLDGEKSKASNQDEEEGMDGEVNSELEEKSRMMETALGLTDLPESEDLSSPLISASQTPSSPMPTSNEPSKRKPATSGVGQDPTKPQLGKAKAQRRARKLAKQAAAGRIDDNAVGGDGGGKQDGGRSTDDWLGLKFGEAESDDGKPAHVFTTRLVPANDDDDMFRETFQESLKIYQRYQQVGHGPYLLESMLHILYHL